MNLWNCCPNLYLICSVSILNLVALDSPSLAVAKISEPVALDGIQSTNTELLKEVSPTSKNAGDVLEKAKQSKLLRIEELSLGSLRDAIASCYEVGADELHVCGTRRSGSKKKSATAIDSPQTPSPVSEAPTATLEDIPQEPTPTLEGQVTSVSQLKDVQPTDWAFQALQSLIERYGVIAGYPDGMFRGNRAITRYEFAAALARINELMATSTAKRVSREDLATLQRLQEEFAAELVTLRGRVDGLEARTVELETTQFSTTTKLSGQVIMAVNAGGFEGEKIVDLTGKNVASRNPNPTFIYRATLDFATSFSGNDLLRLWIETGSGDGSDNTAGFLERNFGSVLDYSIKPPTDGRFGISRLNYTFGPLNDLTVSLGPVIVSQLIMLIAIATLILAFGTLALRLLSTILFSCLLMVLPVGHLLLGIQGENLSQCAHCTQQQTPPIQVAKAL